MRLLHVTDLHLNGDKPHLPRRLTSLTSLVRSVDFVVVSGDLTRGARRAEYQQARAFIRQLVALVPNKDPKRVIIVPGDRDVSQRAQAPFGPFQKFVEEFYGDSLADEGKGFELNDPNNGRHWSCHLFK